MELQKWQSKSDAGIRQYLVLRALENVRNAQTRLACVRLTSGQPPTHPVSKASLKVALDELFIEPLAGQPGKYKVTARGEEMLRAQQMSSKSGLFCPTAMQFATDFKIIDFQDLTAQNKGKRTDSGKIVRTMGVATVDMNLFSTHSSVWYSKKVFSVVPPATGLARGRYLIVQFVDADFVGAIGGIVAVDGKTVDDDKVELMIDKYYR